MAFPASSLGFLTWLWAILLYQPSCSLERENRDSKALHSSAYSSYLLLHLLLFLSYLAIFFLAGQLLLLFFFRDNRPWPESVENGDIEGGNGQTNSIWSREKML